MKADDYIVKRNGPLGVVRICSVCRFGVTIRKPLSPGRGWGFIAGNKARGQLIQHLKTEHPELLK